MIAGLKSELRKIWTVRSTYVILMFAIIIMLIFAFYNEGIKAGVNTPAANDPDKLAGLIRAAITNLAALGALVGVLSFTHEYRYNTITYTLTSSRSRSRTLFAKFATVSLFALGFALFATVFAVMVMYIGLAIKGFSLSHQVVPLNLIWRVLFVSWGYSMYGLLAAVYIRQQVGTIVVFFFLPGLIEALTGLLLKENRVYLPFTALQQVTQYQGGDLLNALTPAKAAVVTLIYLAIGWLIAWLVFKRRDVN